MLATRRRNFHDLLGVASACGQGWLSSYLDPLWDSERLSLRVRVMDPRIFQQPFSWSAPEILDLVDCVMKRNEKEASEKEI